MPDNMNAILAWIGALLAGGALGTFFFAGLWWTVRRGAASPTPVRWFLGSLILRTGIVLLGFYAVGNGQPTLLGLCMLGFLLARTIVLRLTRTSPITVAAAVAVAPAILTTPGEPPCA